MIAGLWRQHLTHDGTYTIDDLLEIHQLMDVKEENDRRISEWQERWRNFGRY